MMVRVSRCLWLFPLIGIFSLVMPSCTDEETRAYPPLVSEFATLLTDGAGIPSELRTDDGGLYDVENAGELVSDSLASDSLYRSIVRYERTEKGVYIYAFQKVMSAYAVSRELLADGVKADPVEMQAIWSGGGYLNMILLVKAQAGNHSFHFVEDSLTLADDGRKTLFLSLSHDAGGDVMAYTRKAYLSVPLAPYKETLASGDSIVFSIPTTRGWQQWVREYGFSGH